MGEDNRALGNWSCSVQNRFEQPTVRERKSCEVKINEWMARRTREAAQMGLVLIPRIQKIEETPVEKRVFARKSNERRLNRSGLWEKKAVHCPMCLPACLA